MRGGLSAKEGREDESGDHDCHEGIGVASTGIAVFEHDLLLMDFYGKSQTMEACSGDIDAEAHDLAREEALGQVEEQSDGGEVVFAESALRIHC